MISLTALLLVILATLSGASGIVLMKKGMTTFTLSRVLHNHKLLLGIVLFGLSTLFFIVSLSFGDLHILYSLTGLTYVWLLFLSQKYLQEHITIQKLIGVGLILLGIAVLSFS